MKAKYFLFYKTGNIETLKEIDKTIERLLKSGIINFIFDIENNVLKTAGEKGIIDTKLDVL